MKPPRSVTVLIDNREKEPLTFPSTVDFHQTRGQKPSTIFVKTKKIRMPEGDYALLDHEDDAIIERKGSLRELSNNFMGDDRKRAIAAFQRLVEATEHPYLLIEESISGLLTPTPYVLQPQIILDDLLDFVQSRGIQLLFVGSCRASAARRHLGEFVVRLLLSHTLRHKVGPVDLMAIVGDKNV